MYSFHVIIRLKMLAARSFIVVASSHVMDIPKEQQQLALLLYYSHSMARMSPRALPQKKTRFSISHQQNIESLMEREEKPPSGLQCQPN